MTDKEFVEIKAKHHYIEFLVRKVLNEELRFEDALAEAKLLDKEIFFRTRYFELTNEVVA